MTNDWEKEIFNCKKLKSNRIIREIDFNHKIQPCINVNNNLEYKHETYYNTEYIKPLAKNETFGINRRTDKKLRNGQLKIDMTVDFHGMTLEEAFEQLLHQLNLAYENKLRCILLITGKGKNTKPGRESIKRNIEKWLKHQEISSKIIKYVDATNKHGGTGAIYVLLKRNKVYKI